MSLAFVYGGTPRWASHAILSMDEARRIAIGISRLPELLGKQDGSERK